MLAALCRRKKEEESVANMGLISAQALGRLDHNERVLKYLF